MTIAPTHDRPHSRSTVKFVRMSATKARVVLDLIRGDHVVDAIETLALSQRRAAQEIAKALRSAVANANHNEEIPTEELYISACYADEGPTLKRFRPRARGRAGRIHKRTCHITVEVARMTDDEIARRNARLEAKGAGTSRRPDRARRVAKSRQAAEAAGVDDDVLEAEMVEREPAEPEATAAGESEATSGAVDSDADGEVNASDESPYGEGSHALIDGDPDIVPDGYPIKGNASSKKYHVPGSSFYARTNAEVWFATEEAAEAAGFVKPASQKKTDDTEGEA